MVLSIPLCGIEDNKEELVAKSIKVAFLFPYVGFVGCFLSTPTTLCNKNI